MPLSIVKIIILALIQGAAELLPISSSAHVIVAEKLMGINPSSPEMTFMLVMLHTGTMFAVIAYFRQAWRRSYFSSREQLRASVVNIAIATTYTLVIGFGLKVLIEKVFARDQAPIEVEDLFSRLPLIAGALAAVGLLIIGAGLREKNEPAYEGDVYMPVATACWIGAIQGLFLPFRGFSRSGATISTGLILDVSKSRAEEFSFALAVVITPVVIAYELLRLLKAHADASTPLNYVQLILPGLIGMFCSFCAGLLALRLLSNWLKAGRWWYFGVYCLIAAAVVGTLARAGY
jgi:undecaprenyl-diphosphatase